MIPGLAIPRHLWKMQRPAFAAVAGLVEPALAVGPPRQVFCWQAET